MKKQLLFLFSLLVSHNFCMSADSLRWGALGTFAAIILYGSLKSKTSTPARPTSDAHELEPLTALVYTLQSRVQALEEQGPSTGKDLLIDGQPITALLQKLVVHNQELQKGVAELIKLTSKEGSLQKAIDYLFNNFEKQEERLKTNKIDIENIRTILAGLQPLIKDPQFQELYNRSIPGRLDVTLPEKFNCNSPDPTTLSPRSSESSEDEV